MTRTERAVTRHWRSIATVCAFVALFGISWALWHRIDASDRKYAAATAEADLRGDAVSTLAGDVRALREQLKAAGKTPVAPDPTKAITNLPDRTEVPVPIPGPPGPTGAPGAGGKTGSNGATGKDGQPGQPGVDSTVPGPIGPAGPTGATGPVGPSGPAGADGKDGKDGTNGTNGQTCPDGYSLQAPDSDPDALICRRDGAPQPTPTPTPTPSAMAALPPDRRRI